MGASILMTVAIIAVGMRVFSTANRIVEDSEQEMVKMHIDLSNSKFDTYDNSKCKGYEVLNVIKMIKDEDIIVKVETTEGVEVTYDKDNEYSIVSEQDNNYINPLGNFASNIIYNGNDVVSELIFEQI
jgi:hypothetical protein